MKRKFKEFSKNRFLKNQRGGVITIFAVSLFAIIGIVSLVVDISREEISSLHLKNLSESASLAAAKELDGTPEGWRRSKRAAIAALKGQNSIYGANKKISEGFSFNSGSESDPYETNEIYALNSGTNGNFELRVERGVYAVFPGEDELSFKSLEEGSTDEINPVFKILPSYISANAVRITTSLDDVTTIFGGVFGIGSFGKISQSSISKKGEIRACSVPFALRACDLLLDPSPFVNSKYEIATYDPAVQCQRELVIRAEADPFSPDTIENRFDGIIRASKYPSFPLFKNSEPNICVNQRIGDENLFYPNCKAIDINGLMGVAGSDVAPGQVSSGEDVINWLSLDQGANNVGCQYVTIGQRFAPLVSPDILENPTYNSAFSNLMLSLINESPDSKEFGEVMPVTSPNFPWLKQFDGTRLESHCNDPDICPPGQYREIYDKIKTREETVYLSRMDPGRKDGFYNYTNPMCHNENIVPDGAPGAKAKEVTVMLIANASTDPNHKYCDFESLFTQAEQHTSAPYPNTEPIVVGFAKINLFDFQVAYLDGIDKFKMPTASGVIHPAEPDFNFNDPIYQTIQTTGATFYPRPGSATCTNQLDCVLDLNPVSMTIDNFFGDINPPTQQSFQPNWNYEPETNNSSNNNGGNVQTLSSNIPDSNSGSRNESSSTSGSSGSNNNSKGKIVKAFSFVQTHNEWYKKCVEACWVSLGCDPNNPSSKNKACKWDGNNPKPCPWTKGQGGEICGEREDPLATGNTGVNQDPTIVLPGTNNTHVVSQPTLVDEELISKVEQLNQRYGECFITPTGNDIRSLLTLYSKVANNPAYTFSSSEMSEINRIKPLIEDCCPSRPGKHCMWKRIQIGCDLEDPTCWGIRDLKMQYGCAGVRGRLSCESTPIFSPLPNRTIRPTLAN